MQAVSIVGQQVETQRPLLITHWGMSGLVHPKSLHLPHANWPTRQYQFTIRVQWIEENANAIYTNLIETGTAIPQQTNWKTQTL